MQSLLKNNSAQKIFIISIIIMLMGLMLSRALLSIGMILLVVGGLLQWNVAKAKAAVQHPLVLMGGLLLIIPLISGIWSIDLEEWWRRCQMKLPLLLLPFAVLLYPAVSKRHYNNISWLFVALIGFGCCWSLYQYVSDYEAMTAAYLKAKVIPTPFDNNHLWFSYAVVIALLLLQQLWRHYYVAAVKSTILSSAVFLVVYLHVLAAKTGLACLYLALMIQIVAWLFQPQHRKKGFMVLLITLFIPVIAYISLPTFKNRLQYIQYDVGEIIKGNHTRELNDGARWRSITVGWDIYTTDTWKGVGMGDLMPLTQQAYDKIQPPLQPWERLMPSSEWIVYPMSAGVLGWLAMLIATILLFFSFDTTSGKSIACLSAFICTYDIPLEGQFSVMIFIFPLLWWMINPHTAKQ